MTHFKDLVTSKSSSIERGKCVEYVEGQQMIYGQTYDISKIYNEINQKMQSFRRGLVKKLTLSEQEAGEIVLNS